MGEGERMNFSYFITNIFKAILFFFLLFGGRIGFSLQFFNFISYFSFFIFLSWGGGSGGIVAHFKVANRAKGGGH